MRISITKIVLAAILLPTIIISADSAICSIAENSPVVDAYYGAYIYPVKCWVMAWVDHFTTKG